MSETAAAASPSASATDTPPEGHHAAPAKAQPAPTKKAAAKKAAAKKATSKKADAKAPRADGAAEAKPAADAPAPEPAASKPNGAAKARGNGARGPADQRRAQRTQLSRRKQAQADALAYRPIKSHPAPLQSVQLCSEHSVALFQKNFGYAHVAFYELGVVLPMMVKAADRDFDTARLINGIEEILISRLEEVSRSMVLRKRQLQEVMKANGGYPPIKPEDYSRVTTVKLPLLTPHTRRLMGVLVQFDEIIRHLDRIWLETHMPDLEHDRAISHCREEVVRNIRTFKRMHVLAGHLVRGLREGKQADISALFAQADNDATPDTVDAETEAKAREATESAMQPAAADG